MFVLKLLAVFVTSVIAIIQALDKKTQVKYLLIFCVIFLLGTTVALEIVTTQEKKNQDRKLDQLFTINTKLNDGVKILQEKLDPFIKRAEKLYPDLTKEEALKTFQTDIEKLETRAKILKRKLLRVSAKYLIFTNLLKIKRNNCQIITLTLRSQHGMSTET